MVNGGFQMNDTSSTAINNNSVFRHKFRYHSVGQGLFMSAEFRLNNKESYKLVYDCGCDHKNSSNLNASIRQLKNEFNGNIDLLIISHFDFDHISGMKDLLDHMYLRKIILPYIDFGEMLMLLLDKKNNVPENVNWYYEFLANPVQFLKSTYNVLEVVFINNDTLKTDQFSQKELRIDELENNVSLEWDYSTLNYLENERLNLLTPSATNLFIPKSFQPTLQISFFNYKTTNIKQKMFRKKLLSIMRYYNLSSINEIASKVADDPVFLKEIKMAYSIITSSHNNVSLCMGYTFQVSKNQELNHVLTGDISLNYKRKQMQFFDHFQILLSKADFLQVPHHGSKYNWHHNLTAFSPNKTEFIATYGVNNSHGHVHSDVSNFISLASKKLHLVDEFQGLSRTY